ncbi:MAG: T9SS type A sorting domain-containing protein [Bacteroidota bacterium]|nr:T9SS type A sorting domain-containing protein [Bacteroidota bacterium]MDP4230382.1 T9SS type A sorting domain-containing protein [Bacteroidota bacterium]
MKYAFLLLILFLCRAASAQPANVTISETTLFDGEPYLAANPTNADNLVIAWMSYVPNPAVPILDQIGIRVKSSFDGGKTWGNELTMPHFVPTYHSADVSMGFHRDGTLYIEYIDYRERPDSGVIVVAHSTDGGKSWSAPIKAFDLYDNDDKPIDRPWIAIDNSGSATDGTIYITTKPAPFDTLPNRPYMKYSTNGGMTWSKIDTVDGGDYPTTLIAAPMVSPAVTASGVFCATYVSWSLRKSAFPRYTLATSTDFGHTYTRTTINTPKTGFNKDTLSKLGYHLSVDPSDPMKMLFVWPDSRDGDNDVYSSYSIDGGATWSAGLRVNDDPINNGVWQDLIWSNFSDNGKCVVSWRDRRNGVGTEYAQGSDIYFAVSTDGGKSFGKNIRLSDQTASFNQVLNGAGNDFHSTSIVHDSICATWGDVRTGKLTIYFAKASLADGIAAVTTLSDRGSDGVSIYPNPTSIAITIELPGSPSAEVFIYDISGKEVYHEGVASIHSSSVRSLDLSNLGDGAYTLLVRTPKEIYAKKLTVRH